MPGRGRRPRVASRRVRWWLRGRRPAGRRRYRQEAWEAVENHFGESLELDDVLVIDNKCWPDALKDVSELNIGRINIAVNMASK